MRLRFNKWPESQKEVSKGSVEADTAETVPGAPDLKEDEPQDHLFLKDIANAEKKNLKA